MTMTTSLCWIRCFLLFFVVFQRSITPITRVGAFSFLQPQSSLCTRKKHSLRNHQKTIPRSQVSHLYQRSVWEEEVEDEYHNQQEYEFERDPNHENNDEKKKRTKKSMNHDHSNRFGISQQDPSGTTTSRRTMIRTVFQQVLFLSTWSSSSSLSLQLVAHARGLVQFPCQIPLMNIYHFMRSGTTLLEEMDIWSTNPLFLTNREAALSETGMVQVQQAAQVLQSNNISPSVVKYSLAASAMDTATILRNDLNIGENRMVPEFTFMDPRAIGKWDMLSYSKTLPAVIALDEMEAGKDGKGGRPPPNIDGTPHETLGDQAIRLRQLLSVLETQYSGDTIVLVFPDGTSPALLSAMLAGIPYNKAHVLEFAPGEIRLNVTMDNTLELYQQKLELEHDQYVTMLEKGKQELQYLNSIQDDQDIVSRKDLLLEQERIQIDNDYQRKQQARLQQEEMERSSRLQRQLDIQREREQNNDNPTFLPSMVIGGGTLLAAYAISGTGKDDKTMAVKNAVNGNTTSNPLLEDGVNGNRTSTLLFHDPPPPPPVILTEEDRIEAANRAMEEYLQEDDGGLAWLKVMEDIIEEEEQEEEIIQRDEDEPQGEQGNNQEL